MPLLGALAACFVALRFACLTFGLVQPKTPKNSYMLWFQDNRAGIVKKLGTEDIGSVGKAAGEEWGKLSARQKKPFETQAAKLKKEYDAEMSEFLASGGELKPRKIPKAAMAGKKQKDPNAPKRNLSAYLLWLNDKRAKINAALPAGSSPNDVTKQAGVLWKKVSAKDKKKYDDLAAKDKERYMKEVEAYNA